MEIVFEKRANVIGQDTRLRMPAIEIYIGSLSHTESEPEST